METEIREIADIVELIEEAHPEMMVEVAEIETPQYDVNRAAIEMWWDTGR